MNIQIGSEFRKLATTRSIYAMLAGLAAVVALGVVAIVRTVSRVPCPRRSSGRRSSTCR